MAATSRAASTPRADDLELFGGSAEVPCQSSRWGGSTLEPIDQLYGTDLTVEANRERVKSWIYRSRPRLVLVEYPCKVWSPIMNLACTTPQARRRLRVRRLRERPFLEFCEEIFKIQMQLGGDALAENPLRSASFQEEPMKRLLNHPEVYHSVGHGCRFGIKRVNSGELFLKPTMWISTSFEICEELSLKCRNIQNPGDDAHGVCLGGSHITQHAGRYTKQIAQAIHRGFVRALKRKEPGRIRQMLRLVSTRIRNHGSNDSLRWTEKSLKKAIDQGNAVFATGSDSLEDQRAAVPAAASSSGMTNDPSEDVKMEPEVTAGNAAESSGKSLQPDGVTFEVP